MAACNARSFRRAKRFYGALLVGNPEEVAEKIVRHSESLGGVSRVTFQMDSADLTHEKYMRSIELLGSRVSSALRGLR